MSCLTDLGRHFRRHGTDVKRPRGGALRRLAGPARPPAAKARSPSPFARVQDKGSSIVAPVRATIDMGELVTMPTMNALAAEDKFVLACLIVVVLLFLLRAIFARLVTDDKAKEDPFKEYLLASQELTPRDVRESTAATFSAFATVFFWFVALGGMYSWVLLLIPLFLVIGNFLFTKVVARYGVRLVDHITIGTFVRSRSAYAPLHYLADFIVAVFLFSALLVELIIGSGIIASMLPLPGMQFVLLLVLSLIVILYVAIGGFRAVVLSDTIQLYLTFGGVAALVIFAIFYLKPSSSATALLYKPDISFFELLAFVVSVITVQTLGPLCQLQNWQRISASKDQDAALRAHRHGALIGAGLWVVMILAALLLYSKLAGSVNINAILTQMKQHGVFPGYALYPLVMVGFVAAMLSTADSALAAIHLLVYDNLRRKTKTADKPFRLRFKHHLVLGAILLLIIVAIYYLNQTRIKDFSIATIYFLYNQLQVVFPVLFYFVVETVVRRDETLVRKLADHRRTVSRILAVALVLGWLVVVVMSAIGYFTPSLNWIMFASAGGVATSGLVSLYAWHILWKVWRGRQSQAEPAP